MFFGFKALQKSFRMVYGKNNFEEDIFIYFFFSYISNGLLGKTEQLKTQDLSVKKKYGTRSMTQQHNDRSTLSFFPRHFCPTF